MKLCQGINSYCPFSACHECKCCKKEVCDRHWDEFNGICTECSEVMKGLPN